VIHLYFAAEKRKGMLRGRGGKCFVWIAKKRARQGEWVRKKRGGPPHKGEGRSPNRTCLKPGGVGKKKGVDRRTAFAFNVGLRAARN